MLRKISGAFTAGVLGALVDSFNIWILGKLGITSMLGISFQPEFTAPWLYPRLVWGGIWGFLFLAPILINLTILRGILFSLVPSAMVLFVVFPGKGKGVFGLGFGALTPALVVFLNFIWGIVGAFWYRHSCDERSRKSVKLEKRTPFP
jgi:hypothetical protein